MKITVVKKPVEPQRQLKLGDVVRDSDGTTYIIIERGNEYGFLSILGCWCLSCTYESMEELTLWNPDLKLLEAELIITE